jgi:D-glycero-D-manno-heptose 1,7-bisphosphate phosphatase
MLAPRPRLFAPIPGTEPPRRGLFVDRWGTLLRVGGGEPGQDFRRVEFLPGALRALTAAARQGWYVYLIGNEEAVAMGRVSDADWNTFQAQLEQYLRQQAVEIRRFYACLDLPEGVPPHRKKSVFQLPETGVFYHAAQEDGIDLAQSWVVGDSTLELVAGARAGLRTAAVRTGQALADQAFTLELALDSAELGQALAEILASVR